ncbi:hypothetical protein U4P09_04515, partial [Klebsiella quasipneumoniae subsp. similipneumoniae]
KEFSHKTKSIDKQVYDGCMHPFVAYDELSFAASELLERVVNDARDNLGLISLKERIESFQKSI